MSLFLVCEGPDDERHLKAMILAVLRESADWLEPEHFQFRGVEVGSSYLRQASVNETHRRVFPNGFGMSARGTFGGGPAAPYAHSARKALQILQKVSESPYDGFVLVCDEDLSGNARIQGLSQARDTSSLADRVAVGAPDPSMESWVLCGFKPKTDQEKGRLDEESRNLKLDPCKEPERLREKTPGHLRNIKRVLDCLCDGDQDREREAASNLARIREVGRNTGAVAFLEECQQRLAPLFGGHRH